MSFVLLDLFYYNIWCGKGQYTSLHKQYYNGTILMTKKMTKVIRIFFLNIAETLGKYSP